MTQILRDYKTYRGIRWVTSDNERELKPVIVYPEERDDAAISDMKSRPDAVHLHRNHFTNTVGPWKDQQSQSVLPSSFSIKTQVQNKVQIEVRYLPFILLVLILNMMLEVAGCLTELHQAIALQCSTMCRLQSP